jgi:hypothetical protein
MAESQDTLFLSQVEQDAVIGWMIKDTQFMLKCKSILRPNYFTHSVPAELFSMVSAFSEKYNRSPTVAELEGVIHGRFVSASDYNIRREKALSCIAATKQIGLEVLADKMTDWLRIVILKNAIQEAAAIFNKKQYDNARDFVSKKMKEVVEADFHQEDRVNYSNPLDFYKNRVQSHKECCTIGHPDFDDALKPGARVDSSANYKNVLQKPSTTGGLIPGDMTVMVGPSNAGKTTSVVSVIAQNILMRKFVLLVTHEQKDEDIKHKIYQCMSRSTSEQLDPTRLETDEDRLRNLNFISQMLEIYLVHVHWIKPGKMMVEDVVDMINLRQEKMVAKEIKNGDFTFKEAGKGFDLLVDDYPAVLKSKTLNSRTLSSHEEKGYIYRQFLELGRHHNFHVLVPSQTNRAGFKSSSEDSDHVLGQGDIADSFAISQVTDNLITINRGPTDKAKHQIRYYVDKSRSGPTGIMFVSKTDFATSRSMGPDLACTVFEQGTNATQNDIDIRLGTITKAIESGEDPKAAMQNMLTNMSNPMPQMREINKAVL